MSTDEIIEEARALPPGERVLVVDSLLRSLNRPDAKVDAEWVAVARERLAEYRAGDVRGVPGAEVLHRLDERFPGA